MNNVRIIKRYANRKLYDTERSCYVTLEDLATLIREGEDIKVIDNKSAEDLTTVTLAQIIFETEKKLAFMPLSLLRGLIQADKADAGELSGQVSQSSQAEQAQQTQTSGGAQRISDLVTHSREAFERLQKNFEDKFKGSMSNVARVASLGRDMEDIRQRLSGVEERINGLPQGGVSEDEAIVADGELAE